MRAVAAAVTFLAAFYAATVVYDVLDWPYAEPPLVTEENF